MRFKLFRENGALNSPEIFNAFERGVIAAGHEVVDTNHDISVIWSVLWNGRMTKNQIIYEDAIKNDKPIIIIEVGNLKRNITWRICLNHINGLGKFANYTNLDPYRPEKLGIKLYNIQSEQRRPQILIATQHSKSLQWQGMPSMADWTLNMIEEIRKRTDMTIVMRPHPRSPMPGIEHEFKNVIRQDPIKVNGTYDDFDIQYNYHCVINHNSGPPIHAAIAGTPVICHESSLAYPVSDKIENILNPSLPDREEWLLRLTHTEWTIEEISQGIPLKRLEKDIISQINS
jgi:hypothetical protein